MINTCPSAPLNKKAYITDIGKILVKDNGKKKFYKPEEVKKAHRESAYSGFDFACWGMSTFSSHEDFDTYHAQTGEACDYAAMKAEMLQGLSVGETASWIDIPDLDLDASWLDFGDVFGGILEGIGQFVGGIADGL